MIGRGHLAGPCPALSYVERAIFSFNVFLKKKKKLKENSDFENPSPSSIPISLPQTIFPPNLSLLLSRSPSPLLNPTVSPPPFNHSRVCHRRPLTSQPPSTTHEPATPLCILHLRPKPNHRAFSISGSALTIQPPYRHEQPQSNHHRRRANPPVILLSISTVSSVPPTQPAASLCLLSPPLTEPRFRIMVHMELQLHWVKQALSMEYGVKARDTS
ncbi:proline-rich extensin-like protein EPR1 [Alnus glutinosa]|uniref:proline-rich extensin-like protein EPR1 n=1 Tax=Alnus glutinosa TaxID=3517 RepID=UPI002D78EB30|nr:proline-rich extensin-like protein EPR1 [Alnus glutinosa]